MRTRRIGTAAPALLLALATLAPVGPGAAPAAAAPAPVAVTASLEPAAIRIGDEARLTVTVEHPAGASVEPPELERGRAVVVTGSTRETAALEGGRERTTLVLLLTSFEVGEHGVGPAAITVGVPGGAALPKAPIAGATLRVRSVLAGEGTPMRGPKGLARWPAPVGRWALIAAGAALLAGAAVFGARRARAARRRRPAPGPPAATPQATALRALAALRASGPIARERVEPHYRDLSAILRRYLEERFGLRAPERTTEEFIREAASSGSLAPAHQELVRGFLEQCDLVKFARHLPPGEDVAAADAAAERLVRET